MNYPNTIRNLIECFKKYPGIGEKSAERLALATMNMNDEILNLFADSLVNVKKKIRRCSICNHLSENEICDICSDRTRDMSTVCVVEEPKNVILFEKIGSYRGLYHVLNGLISPLDGVNPDDLTITSLVNRIKDGQIKEVIIAVKPSVEGDTTALYISKLLQKLPVKVTKIAHGIPIGVDMEYIDALTLELALEDRTSVS